MVELYEPKEDASSKRDKRRESLYKQWLNIAAKFAAKLAQYQSPRLRAVYVKQHEEGAGPLGRTKTTEEVLEKLEARSGPLARALFEKFLKRAAKLEEREE